MRGRNATVPQARGALAAGMRRSGPASAYSSMIRPGWEAMPIPPWTHPHCAWHRQCCPVADR